ncbi:MAG: hypothetical protein PHG02_07875 [Oscillospiraceae bacterium]|nr:hypothetical protein [Oscillospiraceae bacterium]
MYKKITEKSFLFFFAAFVCLLALGIFFKPADAVAAIVTGLKNCYYKVIPALFPFFIVTALVMNTPLKNIFGFVFLPYTRLLKINTPAAASTLLLGFLGGFAVAGKSIDILYRTNQINEKQAALLLCCCVGAGPSFVISSVGYLMFNNLKIGIFLFLSLTLASLFTGVLMKFVLGNTAEAVSWHEPQNDSRSYSSVFTGAVAGAVDSSLIICAYVTLFTYILAVLPLPKQGVTALFCTIFLEVTNGCISAAQFGNIYWCVGALSVLGCSVFLQLRALVSENISLMPLAVSRFIHLPFSISICWLFLRLFPQEISASANFSSEVLQEHFSLPPDLCLLLFVFAAVVAYEIMPNKVFTNTKK